MERKARANKILLLGVDGMDPRLTRKYVDMGILPNIKQYVERGAQRHDLVLLGGHPTVTPPMWTTLATGCYANVHGITGFFRNGAEIGSAAYNIDSRLCKAEQLWNVTAEAGLKTLVWHWPGSAWPPSSDSENLMVVDGTSPGSVAMAVAQVDTNFLLGASEEIPEVTFRAAGASDANAACVITDLDVDQKSDVAAADLEEFLSTENSGTVNIMYKESQQTTNSTEAAMDLVQSPIKPASGWAAAPADAKEFTLLLSKGLIRRPALILKNANGIYDSVAIYKSKKDTDPIVVCPLGQMMAEVVDEAIKGEKRFEKVNRNYRLLKMAEDGSTLTMFVSPGMDMTNDSVWHPKRLFKEVTENVGYPTPTVTAGCQNPMLITDCMLANWYTTADWQAAAIHHLIETHDLDVVFSHYHAIDLEEHKFIKHLAERPLNRQPVEVAQKWMEDLYIQTDYYLGKFLHFLDEGWTVLIFSDHGQVAPKNEIPLLIDSSGVCLPLMEQMGFTVTYEDEKGNKKIDWTKTRAVIQRCGHIYLNIKGRDTHKLDDGTVLDGIVDPADQYELEEEIMTKLYELKSVETGNRIVYIALRNRDAVLLGQGGPEAGDICIWMSENHTFDHGEVLSTGQGESDTSVSPIFIAAGQGIKEGYETERIIRQVDFAATVAVLGGVRMPAQCEGAPVYQILSEEY